MSSTSKTQLSIRYWVGFLGDILTEHGCAVTGVKQARRKCHIFVMLEHSKSGRAQKMVCSFTASDHRAKANQRADAKRICRELANADN